MKHAFFTIAIFVMALANMGMAQTTASLKNPEMNTVMRHYGLRGEGDMPESAIWRNTEGYQQKRTYLYDEYEYYLNEILEQYLSDGVWVNDERVTYDYDFDGHIMEVYDYAWYDEDWYEIQHASYSYEEDEMEIVYQWRELGGEWQNGTKEIYNYNGDVTTVLIRVWNGNTWASSKLHTYTFGDTSIEVLKQYMQGGAWQNEEKETYALDFSGAVKEILVEHWEGTNWVNERKVNYDFQEGSLVYGVREVFDWENGAWVQDHRSSYAYEDGNAYHAYCVRWENDAFVVVDGAMEMAYGNNTNSEMFHGCEIDMTYVDVTGFKESVQSSIFKVYPVPAENELLIQCEGFQKAEIYSLTGQKLMESLRDRIDVGDLSSGVYLLKVFDQSGQFETQRVIVK